MDRKLGTAVGFGLLMLVSVALAPAVTAAPVSTIATGEVTQFEVDASAPWFRAGAKTPAYATDADDPEVYFRSKFPAWDSYQDWEKQMLMKAPDPHIDAMIKSMDKTDMTQLFTDLETGYSLPNRVTGSSNYKKALDWFKGVVQTRRPNLQIDYDSWSSYTNMVITLKAPGATDMYIVGGHYDSVAAGPGMDDDGSGSLGAGWMALAFAGYQFTSEIRFILFDAEESGLIGSDHYAKAVKAGNCVPSPCNLPLKYMINLDMISYDPNNQNKFTIGTATQSLKDLGTQVVNDYQIGIGVTPAGAQGCNSDHCPFDRQGYVNSFHIEPTFNSPNYHKASDKIDKFNWDTLLGVLKTTAGMIATSAGMKGPGSNSTATRLDVTPKTPTIDTTQTQKFDAKGYDANNQPAPLPGPVTWTASGGSIDPQGLYTPAGAGTFKITATSATLTDSTDITVNAAGIVSIKVEPAGQTIKEHQTQKFTAQGCDAQSQCTPLTPDTWAQSGGGTKATIDTQGLFTPDGPGTYKIDATKGAITGSTNLVVEALNLQSMTLKTSDSDCKSVTAAQVKCIVTSKEIQLGVEAVDGAGNTIVFDPINDGKFFDGNWKIDPAGGPVVRADMVVTTDGVTLPYTVKYTAHAFNKDSNQLEMIFVPGPMVAPLKLLPEAMQSVAGGGTVTFDIEAKDAKGNDIVALAPERLTTTTKPKWEVIPASLGSAPCSDVQCVFTGVTKGAGKVKVTVTDDWDNSQLSDDTSVTVTSDGTKPEPPTVKSTTPANGAEKVALTATISITFDKAMEKGSTEGAISASPAISGTFAWSAGDTVVTWTPSAELKDNTVYTVTVGTGARSAQGAALASQHKFSFGTGTAKPNPGGGGGSGGGLLGMGAMIDMALFAIIILVVVAAIAAMLMMGRKKKQAQMQQGAYWQQWPPQGGQGGQGGGGWG